MIFGWRKECLSEEWIAGLTLTDAQNLLSKISQEPSFSEGKNFRKK